ncbi:MAG: 16S rRNA processing protein RimM [Clostridia bacterium]|nr:16S rRNA processing protein RimM [Clostridia bacterium]
MLSTHLMIGEITRPQGIRGEVKVRPATNDPERFYELDHVFFKRGESYVAQKISVSRVEADAVYLTLDGVTDRNAAEALRGEFLYIDRAHAVQLPEDANFICDLIGCEGSDTNGRQLGKMTDVLQPGGNDVYVFHGPLGEVLVPALKSVVAEVNVAEKRILFDAKRLSEVAVFDED